jgi:hypothetical protein
MPDLAWRLFFSGFLFRGLFLFDEVDEVTVPLLTVFPDQRIF